MTRDQGVHPEMTIDIRSLLYHKQIQKRKGLKIGTVDE